jgi:uncharacterized protein
MNESLLKIMACPTCKGPLELHAVEKKEKEIVHGSLVCLRCNQAFPIKDGIPNMLPPSSKC